MQNLDILGSERLFLLNTPLGVTRQGIGSSVCLALSVINPKVVTREFLSLADLFQAQTLCVYELAEVVMIGEYQHLILRLF